MISIIKKHITWVFSGVGVAVIAAFLGLFYNNDGISEAEKSRTANKNDISAPAIVNSDQSTIIVNNHPASEKKALIVEYDFYDSEISMKFGNSGDSIYLVDQLTVHWNYSECPTIKVRQPNIGARVVPYKYYVSLTKSSGQQLLDKSTFEYPKGETDIFEIDLQYPGFGIYEVWTTFNHKELGENVSQYYTSEKSTVSRCVKYEW